MALFQKSDTDWQLWERRGEKRELTTESQQNLHPRRFVFSFSLSFGERCDRVYNNSEMKREGVLPRYKGDHELYVKGRLRMTLNPSQVSFVHLLSCTRGHSSARQSERMGSGYWPCRSCSVERTEASQSLSITEPEIAKRKEINSPFREYTSLLYTFVTNQVIQTVTDGCQQ